MKFKGVVLALKPMLHIPRVVIEELTRHSLGHNYSTMVKGSIRWIFTCIAMPRDQWLILTISEFLEFIKLLSQISLFIVKAAFWRDRTGGTNGEKKDWDTDYGKTANNDQDPMPKLQVQSSDLAHPLVTIGTWLALEVLVTGITQFFRGLTAYRIICAETITAAPAWAICIFLTSVVTGRKKVAFMFVSWTTLRETFEIVIAIIFVKLGSLQTHSRYWTLIHTATKCRCDTFNVGFAWLIIVCFVVSLLKEITRCTQ